MTYIHKSWRNNLVHSNSSKATNRVLEMVDEGLLNPRDVLLMALKWMGESDVAQMCEANEIELEETD